MNNKNRGWKFYLINYNGNLEFVHSQRSECVEYKNNLLTRLIGKFDYFVSSEIVMSGFTNDKNDLQKMNDIIKNHLYHDYQAVLFFEKHGFEVPYMKNVIIKRYYDENMEELDEYDYENGHTFSHAFDVNERIEIFPRHININERDYDYILNHQSIYFDSTLVDMVKKINNFLNRYNNIKTKERIIREISELVDEEDIFSIEEKKDLGIFLNEWISGDISNNVVELTKKISQLTKELSDERECVNNIKQALQLTEKTKNDE